MAESASHTTRRDKPILSCLFCRGRKLRCDRQSPCSNCTRRGNAANCTYSTSEQQRKDAVDYRPRARSQQARQRIDRLENLVIEMRDRAQSSRLSSVDTASPNIPPDDSGSTLTTHDDDGIDELSKLSLTDDQVVYTGSSHWVTILEDIQHLKDDLAEKYTDITSPEPTSVDVDLMYEPPTANISLLKSTPAHTREQILVMMPMRKVVDRLVSHFFNAFDIGPFVLNRRQFLAEYSNFWDDPSAAPIMWIGLLFSIMSMSALMQQKDAGALGLSSAEAADMMKTYRMLTIHCLVTGDYLRPSKYTMETLILHFGVDQNLNQDESVSNWVLIGVVIRIALRMGLHRDPSHWPDIRPLQAELRRRLWIALYQIDFFTSTQVGLPRTVQDSQCDTRPPAHLFEHDLGSEHNEVPPERSFEDTTPLSHMIERDAIIKVAAEIYDATEAGPPSSVTIAALSAKLERAIEAIPARSKYDPLETSVAENPLRILQQIFLDILVHKAVYLLHRRSFVKGSAGVESTKSNELCIAAALAILDHQRRLKEEIQPGGLLFSIRWKVASSLNHEFLQATMMLCFALSRSNERQSGATESDALYRRNDILQALASAKSLWDNNVDQSMEARKASSAIATVLQQDMERFHTPNVADSDDFFAQMPVVGTQSYFDSFNYEQSMDLDPSLLSVENDATELGSVLGDFVAKHSHT